MVVPDARAQGSSVDEAIHRLLAKDAEGALRHSAALLRAHPERSIASYLAGRALAKLGARDFAATALELSIEACVDASDLPLAVVACRELAKLGDGGERGLDAVAQAFAAGSARLSAVPVAPPAMPGKAQEVAPLASTLTGAALIAEAGQCVQAGRAAHAGGGRGVLSPQAFLSQLSPPALRAMLQVFETMMVASGAPVIQEGTTGSEAFILARGELEVLRSVPGEKAPIELAHLGAGALFGEMALLSRAPRAASVVAMRPSILLVARKDGLDSVAQAQPEVGRVFATFCRRRMVDNLVRTSPMLRAVSSGERAHLVEKFVTRTFEQGAKIISQGQNSDGLYLIASGEVSIVHRAADDNTFIARLGPGEVVGEVALVLRRPANADVLAVHPTITMHLPRDHFLELIRAHPAVLAELYELAIKRDEETTSIVAQEAADVDDAVLV